jgi:hypothetical protein
LLNILRILPEGVLIFDGSISKLKFANKISKLLLFSDKDIEADIVHNAKGYDVDKDSLELESI